MSKSQGFSIIRDPNWGEIGIWGTTPETEAMEWYEKYAYLKKTFAADGVLMAIHRGRRADKFALGDDAQRIFNAVNDSYDLKLESSSYGLVIRSLEQPGHIPGALQEKDIPVYWYFVGTAWQNLQNEIWGVDDFLDELDGVVKPSVSPRQFVDEQFTQLSLFDEVQP